MLHTKSISFETECPLDGDLYAYFTVDCSGDIDQYGDADYEIGYRDISVANQDGDDVEMEEAELLIRLPQAELNKIEEQALTLLVEVA